MVKWIASLFVVVVLSGCSLFNRKPSPPGLDTDSVSLESTPNVNLNSALIVDLVVVYDPAVLKKLEGMTATHYLSSIDQIRRDNMSAIDVWRWELVPGQMLQNYQPVFPQDKAWGGLFFFGYQTPGDHRVGLGTSPSVNITLGEKEVKSITTAEPSSGVEKMLIYPVGETVLLNTRTPNTGLTQQSYEKMQKAEGEEYPAQKQKTEPSAVVGN